MFSLVERSIHTAWKPFCKFDRFFSVTGSATILGNERINFFNNEKKNPTSGRTVVTKINTSLLQWKSHFVLLRNLSLLVVAKDVLKISYP